jgi:hypothetical protein
VSSGSCSLGDGDADTDSGDKYSGERSLGGDSDAIGIGSLTLSGSISCCYIGGVGIGHTSGGRSGGGGHAFAPALLADALGE